MSHPEVTPSGESHRRTAGRIGWLLPIGFIMLAGWLLASSRRVDIPLSPVQSINRDSLKVGPGRIAMTDPAHILIEGKAQNCNGCHQIFKSSNSAGTQPSFHQEIRLNHGLNNRCLNCHDAGNREQLTLRDGATVSFAETPTLCSQCHGTVYRDWERGTHGKTLGSWITHSTGQRRLTCNECHDPHSPKYEPYVPLPGPNTLRMGDQHLPAHHGSDANESPLRRRIMDPGASPPGEKPHGGDHP